MRRSPLSLVLLLACAHPAAPPRAAVAPRAAAAPAAPAPPAAPPAPPRSFVDETGSFTEFERVTAPPSPDAVCAVADDNIARAAAAVLAAPPPAGPTPPRATWDHARAPRYLDLVTRRYGLRPGERATLMAHGFVVLAREERPSYADAFHDVYRSQVPVYVSADAVLHAVYRTNDALLADLEARRLAPLLDRALDAMHGALPAAAPRYPPEVARDLDVYLTVARSLLAERAVPSKLGGAAEAAALVARATRADDLAPIELFGRARMVDFSQYRPRGHYATRPRLAPYFRAAMWLSRLEFNLVSRSSRSSAPGATPDPRETPREAVGAMALADLAERAGAAADVDLLDRAWGVLAGPREDVSRADLAALRDRAGIADLAAPDAADRLRAVIGDRFQRTARIHYMPQGSHVLPAIATLLGPRITPDTAMTRPLVHGAVRERYEVGVADAAYAFGHDRALRYLASDLQTYPALRPRLDEARAIARRPRPDGDLYGAWYGAVLALAERPEGARPSFMETESFADLRLNSVVAAYGQLRHNYVLMVGQSYDEGGCEIPDGFVEPVPGVYDALITYADRGAAVVRALATPELPLDREAAYFATLGARLRVLRAIVRDELANRPLSAEARRFLSMVTEVRPGSTGGPPTYTGWYFDLFRERVDEGLAGADFIADWYTSSNTGRVVYAGARAPRLGLFVVDTGGVARVFVGPVARAYEHRGPLDRRLTDEEARDLPSLTEPWAASYTAPAPAAPPLALSLEAPAPGEAGPWRVTLRGGRSLGRVSLGLLDHHYVPLRTLATAVGTRPTRLAVRPPPGFQAVRVEVGAYRAVLPVHWAGASFALGDIATAE